MEKMNIGKKKKKRNCIYLNKRRNLLQNTIFFQRWSKKMMVLERWR